MVMKWKYIKPIENITKYLTILILIIVNNLIYRLLYTWNMLEKNWMCRFLKGKKTMTLFYSHKMKFNLGQQSLKLIIIKMTSGEMQAS